MMDKMVMSELNEQITKPVFLRIAGVLLICSIISQVYFFTVINDILSKEFSAMGIIEGVIEWIYLVGPSFFFAVVFFGMSIFCWLVSHLRKEDGGAIKWLVGGAAITDLLTFMAITVFHYG